MDRIKNNTIAVYILSRSENYWAEFKKVYVSNETISEINNGESESLVIYTKDVDMYDNYRIYERTKKSVLWLSTEPGDIIETDYAIFWLPEANYSKALDILNTKILNGRA